MKGFQIFVVQIACGEINATQDFLIYALHLNAPQVPVLYVKHRDSRGQKQTKDLVSAFQVTKSKA